MATKEQVNNFIAEIAPFAQKAYKTLGKVKPSVCIGMACVESAYGTAGVMRSHNAFFGQKCGTGKTATKYWGGRFYSSKTSEEYTVGTHTPIVAAFRAYDSMEQSVFNYYELLNTKLYDKVLANANYKTQMAQIKECGYMTSSTEVNSVITVIEKYGLTKYDSDVVTAHTKGLTGKGLAEYAISKIGTPYFYGTKMQTLTESYMSAMNTSYPNVVTQSYMKKARNKGQVGKINTDCSGLIGAYRNKQIGSSQLYSTAKKRLPISDVNNFAIGTVLWHSGHVGVYVGDGYCVEAKGIDYGTIKSKVSATKWVYGLTFSDIEYDYDVKVSGYNKGVNPYIEPTVNIKKGSVGEGVKWVQWELNEAGFNLVIDGECGNKTKDAIKSFQQSCKITVDGICGKQTRMYLKEK